MHRGQMIEQPHLIHRPVSGSSGQSQRDSKRTLSHGTNQIAHHPAGEACPIDVWSLVELLWQPGEKHLHMPVAIPITEIHSSGGHRCRGIFLSSKVIHGSSSQNARSARTCNTAALGCDSCRVCGSEIWTIESVFAGCLGTTASASALLSVVR